MNQFFYIQLCLLDHYGEQRLVEYVNSTSTYGLKSLWINKAEPDGWITKVEAKQLALIGDRIGYQLTRGQAFLHLMDNLVDNLKDNEARTLKLIRDRVAPGWGSNAVAGNVCDEQTFQQTSARLYKELMAYCDLRGNTNHRTNAMILYPKLERLRHVAMHPNRFYAAWNILFQLQISNSFLIRNALTEHKKNVRYSKDYYVTDYLHHLQCWVDELADLGHTISMDTVFDEFLGDFIAEHEVTDSTGSDDYLKLCHVMITSSYVWFDPDLKASIATFDTRNMSKFI